MRLELWVPVCFILFWVVPGLSGFWCCFARHSNHSFSKYPTGVAIMERQISSTDDAFLYRAGKLVNIARRWVIGSTINDGILSSTDVVVFNRL